MGSCFAQHIATVLRERGLNVPFFDTTDNFKSKTYSANYGNIYTVSQALQLVEEVAGNVLSSKSSGRWKTVTLTQCAPTFSNTRSKRRTNSPNCVTRIWLR
ncbi:GSCFA domain-containing protein [Thalassospira sp.]|uniref:GSCFA domain-containing protein n=1 Tax=Thalassospira sp. TaxID=1912094 RepID=UPI0034572239